MENVFWIFTKIGNLTRQLLISELHNNYYIFSTFFLQLFFLYVSKLSRSFTCSNSLELKSCIVARSVESDSIESLELVKFYPIKQWRTGLNSIKCCLLANTTLKLRLKYSSSLAIIAPLYVKLNGKLVQSNSSIK